jgi:GntR family transcriptional regulator of vanillate catabolism
MGAGTEGPAGQSQLEHVTTVLRARILSGAFGPGTRLMEVPVAEMLGTSRTPVRLALSILQQERLVVAAGHRRGFTVNGFTLEEVFAAIETRGALEAMAARQVAEKGLAGPDAGVLRACLAEGDALLARDLAGPGWDAAWAANNVAFHRALVDAAGNRAIPLALEPLNRIPLAAPSALVLRTQDRAADLSRLQRAHADHRDILEAVEAGQGSRAEALVREHAALNIRNKRSNFAEIKARKAAGDFPGLDLVAGAAPAIPAPRRVRRNRD